MLTAVLTVLTSRVRSQMSGMDTVSLRIWDSKRSNARTVIITAENAKTVCWSIVLIVQNTEGKVIEVNDNQRRFLNEFHDLLRKYSVDEMFISYHSGDKRDYRITLSSNGQKLEFTGYFNNYFAEVGTYDGNYKVGDEDE